MICSGFINRQQCCLSSELGTVVIMHSSTCNILILNTHTHTHNASGVTLRMNRKPKVHSSIHLLSLFTFFSPWRVFPCAFIRYSVCSLLLSFSSVFHHQSLSFFLTPFPSALAFSSSCPPLLSFVLFSCPFALQSLPFILCPSTVLFFWCYLPSFLLFCPRLPSSPSPILPPLLFPFCCSIPCFFLFPP